MEYLLLLKFHHKKKKKFGEFVESAVDNLKENGQDNKLIFKETLFEQIKIIGILWILGCTVIASFTIYILMTYKGFLFRLHNNDNNFNVWCKNRN